MTTVALNTTTSQAYADGLSRGFTRLQGRLSTWLRLAEDRRALEVMDERLLRDIGLTPGDLGTITRRRAGF